MKYIGILIFVGLLLSCGSSQSEKASDTKASDSAAVVAPSVLPSIPEEDLKNLFVNCDYVDYIFYELPFSMSYENKNSIQSSLQWVSSNFEIPASGCKALGRMIFQVNGDQVMEAELYVSDTCGHYIWYKDGKKAFANKMTNQGHQHYMGIIKQYTAK